jgi:glycosyltransferase involved in cell wall biosynthesis
MPFAPITRAEDAPRLYRNLAGAEHAAEFMTITFEAEPELAGSCPAVVHVDGTVRPQIVHRDSNPFLHAVLTEYARLTGVSSVINTSFNIHEEPIVCTPEDALRGFLHARLDYLFIEGSLVSLEDNLSLLRDAPTPTMAQGQVRETGAALVEHLWRELHNVRNEASERLRLVEQLHVDCQRYREQIDDLQQRLAEFQEKNEPTAVAARELESGAVQDAGDSNELQYDSADVPVVLETLRRLETRVELLLQEREQTERESEATRSSALQLQIAALQFQKGEAEAAAEARLGVIEEQRRAIEHYRYWRFRERLARLVQPRIGVLYQYPPRQLDIPPRYRKPQIVTATPTISIVTPSYNQGHFIALTLDSVLDQRYPELEYILQDGASTDQTLEVLEQYQGSLSHIDSARDDGFAEALNLGFARSAGEIMAYLNSDDLLLPGALQYVANFFSEHPDVDVVYGHRVVIDEYGEEIGRWVLPPHEDEVLSWADYVPQETLFWRRDLWKATGAHIDASFRFAVDWDLLIRFRDAGARMARLPRFLGAFRVHPHQKTSSEMADVGNVEMNRLRERMHGRPVTHQEIHSALRPYLRKHVAYHKLYRLGLLRY